MTVSEKRSFASKIEKGGKKKGKEKVAAWVDLNEEKNKSCQRMIIYHVLQRIPEKLGLKCINMKSKKYGRHEWTLIEIM